MINNVLPNRSQLQEAKQGRQDDFPGGHRNLPAERVSPQPKVPRGEEPADVPGGGAKSHPNANGSYGGISWAG